MTAAGRGCVVWFTGLPASGKTTLAQRVRARLCTIGVASALLDSDEVRAALLPALGYDEAARTTFYGTLARLAALLAGQGLVVLVAATANRRAYRDAARSLAPRFVEVYLATDAAECRRRDAKGLYAAAAAGAVSSLPGAGADYEPPLRPEVIASGGEDEAAVAAVVRATGSSRARCPAPT